MIGVPVGKLIEHHQRSGNISSVQAASLRAGGLPNTLQSFQNAAIEARNYWSEAAMGRVMTTGKVRMASQYSEAIQASEPQTMGDDPWHIVITPDQSIAHRAEDFIPAYDMKPGILAGPNKQHHDAQGRIFKNIPFKHTKDSIPSDIQALMENKKPVKTEVKESVSTIIIAGKEIHRWKTEHKVINVGRWDSLKKKELPEHHQKPGLTKHGDLFPFRIKYGKTITGKSIFGPMKDYEHKSPKYAGLTKIKSHKEYEKKTETTYMTWRYMGAKSPPWSWWHPGFPANPIREHIEPELKRIFIEHIREGLQRDIRDILES